jgi:hypothetical protein
LDEPEREGYVYLGTVGVDSGCLMICDPSYVLHGEDPEDDGAWPITVEQAMEVTTGRRYGGIQDGVALVFRSGYGDGSYHVYGKQNEDGRIVEVVIDMQMTDVQKAVFEEYRKQSTE